MMKLDQNCPPDVRSRVSYCSETGVFIAIKSAGRRKAGDQCGYPDRLGYIKLAFDGKWVLAHRLAWFFYYGKWPKGEIDHINGDPSDNRIVNLRCGSRRQNMQNAASGKGWHWHSSKRCWQALIRVDGKRKYLGTFKSERDAKAAYLAAAERYFGEWSVHNRPTPPKQEAFDV